MEILIGVILAPFAIGAVLVSTAMIVGIIKGIGNSFRKDR